VHLLVADRLVCPRCGPPFGLILLAERVVERRVLAGSFGCPNCRDRFAVVDGFADLRPPPRKPLPEPSTPPPQPDSGDGLRLAAFLGITEGPARVLLAGAASPHAASLVELVPELEVAAMDPALRAVPPRTGVSRMAAGAVLPFQSHTFQGVALAGEDGARLLAEAVRVLAHPGRIVLLDAPADLRSGMEGAGLRVVLDEGGVLVAERAGPRARSGGVRLPVV